MPEDVLLEIGCEELPASFVNSATSAFPELARARLRELRLAHGSITALGTPRRLALIIQGLADAQPDLDEQLLGPPARVAYDAAGKPTKAALSFAAKLGLSPDQLLRIQTDKGEYLAGRKQEKGIAARELLPAALERFCESITFRKSMRWSDGDTAFGRPVRWLVALLGSEPLDVSFAGVRAGRFSRGHRFLSPTPVPIANVPGYAATLAQHHVVVDAEERKRVMLERLHEAARSAGGELVSDAFLVEENASLVEEPHVVVGSFDASFLALPERVILNVARGHQRYFGVRAAGGGQLLSRYLAVVNTALNPDNIRRGNDRVMRARLADAKFFYDEDLKRPLGEHRAALDGIVFHKRLGSVGDKVRRLEALLPKLAALLGLPDDTARIAREAAGLAKCDLTTLMVGELPELEGEMGQAYALAQGVDAQVAAAISEHYLPRGVDDPTAASPAGALVAIADRLDTLTGCFAVGIMPTGTADPLALRRAAIGTLRSLLDKGWDLSLSAAIRAAHAAFHDKKLDFDAAQTDEKLVGFFRARLRGLLSDELPNDAVDAVLAVSAGRPYDVALRARALAKLEPSVRQSAGEVFKRAANIAKDAPAGAPLPPREVLPEVHPSEQKLFDALAVLDQRLSHAQKDYAAALGTIAEFAPVLGRYFDDVFVMVDDEAVRNNRLRLMKKIHKSCASFANFSLLAQPPAEKGDS
jgi:glycyl-tRNA synthetase beta chain